MRRRKRRTMTATITPKKTGEKKRIDRITEVREYIRYEDEKGREQRGIDHVEGRFGLGRVMSKRYFRCQLIARRTAY